MAPKALPDAETLRNLLEYDPNTGSLTWLVRPLAAFKTKRAAAIWNKRFAGMPALSSPTRNGYLHGAIHYGSFLAHRIIWKMVTGNDPEEDIDHINGVRTDNRWCNLRSCPRAENMRNRGVSRNNTSGTMGVMWQRRDARWEAYIDVNGSRKYIGHFVRKEDAINARLRAEREHGYHPNHGQRARHHGSVPSR